MNKTVSKKHCKTIREDLENYALGQPSCPKAVLGYNGGYQKRISATAWTRPGKGAL